MAQRRHPVFGGELLGPQGTPFRDTDAVHSAGLFPDHPSAHGPKAGAQRAVDSLHTRYVIAHLHRLRDDEASGTRLPPADGRG